jgi:hypothetical protein
MKNIVIKSGEYELTIAVNFFNSHERYLFCRIRKEQTTPALEVHHVRFLKGETPEQWLRRLVESNPETELWIGNATLYFGDYRSCNFGAYGFKREQIREAIRAALTPEKPRMIFRAEDGQRYEWMDGDFREVFFNI